VIVTLELRIILPDVMARGEAVKIVSETLRNASVSVETIEIANETMAEAAPPRYRSE
jgi:uncharacterized protein YoaH (UPF0181 family)